MKPETQNDGPYLVSRTQNNTDDHALNQAVSDRTIDQSIMQQALDEISCGMVITEVHDGNNPIIYANKGFEKLTGYSLTEALGCDPRILQGTGQAVDTKPMRREIRRAIEAEDSCKTVLRNYRKDGTAYWAELVVAPLRNRSGRVCNYVGIQTDITDLIQEKEKLNDALEHTLVGSISTLVDVLGLTCPTAHSITKRVSKLANRFGKYLPLESPWQLRSAVLLSHLGCIALADDLVLEYLQGKPLDRNKQELIDQYPANGAELISHIPHLSDVAEGIANQNMDFEPRNSQEKTTNPAMPSGKQVPYLARILRIVTEYDRLFFRLGNRLDAIESMTQNQHRFDPDLFEIFCEVQENHSTGVIEPRWEHRTVSISMLKSCMVVNENLHNIDGVLLVSKGQHLTQSLRMKLRNFMKLGKIKGTLDVLVQVMNNNENAHL